MKTDSHAEGKAVKASRKRLIKKDSTGVSKETKKTNRNPQQGSGQNKELLARQDKNCSPAKDSGESYSELSLLIERTGNIPVIDLYTRQTLLPLEKIKLQLFPINEVTRMRLVKCHGGMEQAFTFQDSGTNGLLNLRTNDERSLGLKVRMESLGPFDLGLHTVQMLIGGESVSITGSIR